MVNIQKVIPSPSTIPKNLLPFCEMTAPEREFTARAIACAKPKNILEVGVSAGGSTIVLLDAIKDMSETKLISIDIMENWWQNKSMPVGWLVDVMYPNRNINWSLYSGKDPSQVVLELDKKFDFLLLDTAHKHPVESLNFLTVLPVLTDNATIVLHDIGLYSNSAVSQVFACKLLFDSVVAEKEECFDYNYSLASHNANTTIYYPNIGCFRINADTRKYVRNVFSMLRYPWEMLPGNLGDIHDVLQKYYDDECLHMFRSSIAVNLSYLFCNHCYDFTPIGNAFCEIEANLSAVRDKLKQSKRIIFHGAGKLCDFALHLFAGLGLPLPTEIWDKQPEMAKLKGYAVSTPNYESLNEHDIVIITITDCYAAHGVTANAICCSCKNIITLRELATKCI